MADHLLVADPPPLPTTLSDPAATPAEHAARLVSRYLASAPELDRRRFGQFFTPLPVARLMARLATDSTAETIRVLEPGAGTGVLTSALCESLRPSVRRVHIDAFEIHPQLADLCEEALGYASCWLQDRGTECTFTVHRTDFILASAARLTSQLFDEPRETYDIAIANPPYFKLPKDDPRAVAASAIVHGQPNIYAIFMAIMASLLRENGTMVTITPRSFTAGDYFRRFREVVFGNVVPDAIHLFASRRDAFREDEVLQENVIMRARRRAGERTDSVAISTSSGARDLENIAVREVELQNVVDLKSGDLTVHIPTSTVDDEILALVRSWPQTLHALGLQVSTGPVVAFRATKFLRAAESSGTVPLLWLQHVRQMRISWPAPTAHRPRKRVRGAVAAESDLRRDEALQRQGRASPDRGRAASEGPIAR
jgi:adenine-specific DNA-methyltransferase